MTHNCSESKRLKLTLKDRDEEIQRLKAEAGNYSEKEGYETALDLLKKENERLKSEIPLNSDEKKTLTEMADTIQSLRTQLLGLQVLVGKQTEVLKLAHGAIDILFAMLIESRDNFFPSKSGKPWEAAVKINEAISLSSPEKIGEVVRELREALEKCKQYHPLDSGMHAPRTIQWHMDIAREALLKFDEVMK